MLRCPNRYKKKTKFIGLEKKSFSLAVPMKVWQVFTVSVSLFPIRNIGLSNTDSVQLNYVNFRVPYVILVR